ncbi:NAD(P)/FAD-dependent oxidoreductase, partial [Clostridium sp. ZS2-4]|uniref:NAD(P)/FAD-dependent oxidoreductase n=1 Tax=Clostridium sp. ZS2-4 TaxID=2987703 RepID=UPI00227BF371
MFDITIIGAGVTGCAIARELSKYKLKTCVLEKEIDVASGTSKANSGIVHAGEDPTPGTLKAKMNVRGNEMFDKLQEELDFPFKRNGSLVLCFDEKDMDKLEEMRQHGLVNGVPDTMEILKREESLKLEPNLSDKVVGALT